MIDSSAEDKAILPDTRYQIFLSSTFRDLSAERSRILRELATSNYIATGMEHFPAMDEEQFEFIKTIIDEADYYVVVVAGKYGSLAPDGKGYSEKEYEYALDRTIPVIALLRDMESLPPNNREEDLDKLKMLNDFRKRLETGRLVAFWSDEADLCLKLLRSLQAMTRRNPRPGWVRGGKEAPEKLLARIVDLEASNKVLQGSLYEYQNGPLVENIRKRLKGTELTISFFQSMSNSEEERVTVPWQEFCDFAFPKLMRARGDDGFAELVLEFIEHKTGKKPVRYYRETVEGIIDTLKENGLLSDWQQFHHTVYLVSKLGFYFARTAIQEHRGAKSVSRQRSWSFVLNDVGVLVTEALDRMFERIFLRTKAPQKK
jgi:hypothetical protein